MQRCSPYLRWKQCTSFVTTVTIFPRSRAGKARVTRSVERSDDLSCCKTLPRAPSPVTHLSLAQKRRGSYSRVTVNHKPVISAQSSRSCFKHPAEAWARGDWAQRWAGSGFGWRASEELAARLRMLKPHVIGQRWSALLEQGASAAAEALMPSQSSESGPSYWACSASPPLYMGLSTENGHFSSWLEKGRIEMWAECEI